MLYDLSNPVMYLRTVSSPRFQDTHPLRLRPKMVLDYVSPPPQVRPPNLLYEIYPVPRIPVLFPTNTVWGWTGTWLIAPLIHVQLPLAFSLTAPHYTGGKYEECSVKSNRRILEEALKKPCCSALRVVWRDRS